MTSPTCRDMSELVTSYLERTLPLWRRLEARWHLARCPACQNYFAQMRATVRLLHAAPPATPPPGTEAVVLARLDDGSGDGSG